MRNLLFLIILLLGCTPDINEDKDDTVSDTTSDTNYPSAGIVSTDPPGADDWVDDSDSTDSSEPEDSQGGDTGGELKSYEDCSNFIDHREEPDPLNRPCNFRLQDQNGNKVELYDFQGDVILLDFSTMWCSVCKTVAQHVQEMHDNYTPFSAITILTEDSSGNPPTVDNLREWAAEYHITTAPILASDDSMIGTEDHLWNVNGLPCFFIIDKDFYVRKTQPGWNESRLTEYIQELILE